jgi:ELWxxDGT repeat protein
MTKSSLLSRPKTHLKRGLAVATVLLTMIASLQISAASAVEPEPSRVLDIYEDSSNSAPSELTAVGETLYFTANTGAFGRELWKSDGTAAGTVLVRDIKPDNSDSDVTNLTAVGNTLYFTATDGVNGNELWKSNGTSETTMRVKDIWVGQYGSDPANLTAVGNTLYFTANDGSNDSDPGIHGNELWRSDGTEVGTVIVRDIFPGRDGGGSPKSSSPMDLKAVGDKLYFIAQSIVSGSYELWRSDGTQDGTVITKDINSPGDDSVQSITGVGDAVYFSATDTFGSELWKTRGTSETTVRVKDINPTSGSNPGNLFAVGNSVYFSADDGVNGTELWRSDGTEGGTSMVRGINPTSDGNPRNLFAVGNILYFSADDGVNGTELWRSDGTEGGTTMVKDIWSGSDSGGSFGSNPRYLTSVGSKFFFQARTGDGRELWSSDGTAAGTDLVKDLSSGSSDPINLKVVPNSTGSILFFSATDGTTGIELWSLEFPNPVAPASGSGNSDSATPTPTPTATPPVVEEPATTKVVRFSQFAGDSANMPARATRAIGVSLSGYSTVERVVCTGFTSGVKTTALGRKIALQRAQNACNVVKRIAPKADIQVRINVASGVGPRFRSVQLSITGK